MLGAALMTIDWRAWIFITMLYIFVTLRPRIEARIITAAPAPRGGFLSCAGLMSALPQVPPQILWHGVRLLHQLHLVTQPITIPCIIVHTDHRGLYNRVLSSIAPQSAATVEHLGVGATGVAIVAVGRGSGAGCALLLLVVLFYSPEQRGHTWQTGTDDAGIELDE